MRLYQEGETIRNGLLQEIFALRRHLELSHLSPAENSEQTDSNWVAKTQGIYQTLQHLGDFLAPPYLEDSLPLAIQHGMESWRIRYPLLRIDLKLPADWYPESQEHSQVLLTALHELLQIAFVEPLTAGKIEETGCTIVASLNQLAIWHELRVQITYSDIAQSLTCSRSQDLKYLRRAFQVLTDGVCFQSQKAQTLSWHFRWRCPKAVKSNHS
jgi:hypothetical protein